VEDASDAAKIRMEVINSSLTGRGPELRVFLPHAGRLGIDVFDPTGRAVRSLAAGEYGIGQHSFAWDGRSKAGRPVASGVYLVRALFDGSKAAEKIIVIR
jgi:flagellar hook assembly protein FlgD